MSASSKKKLRKEQESAKLTEKQLTAQKEAKNLKLLTAAFVTVLSIILVIAVTVGVNQTITSNGIREKKTVALTIGEHELNSVEMNYFFVDAVNSFYTNYGSYAGMFGLDPTKSLNEQVVNEETGETWADDFLSNAKSTAQAVYAVADAAKAAGFTLSEEQLTDVELAVSNINGYAIMYGFADGNAFLQAKYGKGANLESYEEYAKLCALADAYQSAYGESLTYTDEQLRAVDAHNYEAYNSYSYNSYFLSSSKFLTGDAATATAEDKAASAVAAEAAAKELTESGITTAEALDAAIAALPVNEGVSAASTAYPSTLSASVNTIFADWITDSSRQAGDLSYFPSESTDADGNKTVTGYYIVLFNGADDNTDPMINVRHILVKPEGGTTDPNTGVTTYSEEEMAAAKTSAEELLAQWQAGEATEESFGALAIEHSADTGSAANGGLIENVYPGQMVVNFNDWCFDDIRKTGDFGIVESTYGYHVMYFVGDSDMSYRDYMISTELRNADVDTWFTGLTENAVITDGDFQYLALDMTLSG